MAEPFDIFGLEIHASHACNLHCLSCGHFSSQHYGRNVPVAAAGEWMRAWHQRVRPSRFAILGGEPTLNPELCEYVRAVRFYWPKTKIHVVTNGFFLHRHPQLPQVLVETKPSRLVLSRHHNSAEYMKRYDDFRLLVESWRDEHGIEIELQQGIQHWTRRYFGSGDKLRPYRHNNPQGSFAACKMKNRCRNLFNFKLYKCPPLAYINLVGETYQLSSEWDRYRAYSPLTPDCTSQELQAWLQQKAIPECAMCFSRPEQLVNIPNPLYPPP